MNFESIQLKNPTPESWIHKTLENFDSFLIDHAACERKASAMGLNFVVRYHDKPELSEAMIRFAREELYHFHQVAKLVFKRGLKLAGDEKDPYINAFLAQIRNGRSEQLLDRLLIIGIVEARGHERFSLVAEHVSDKELKDFYTKLSAAELGHQGLFLKMARHYFSEQEITTRLVQLVHFESELMLSQPIQAKVH